MKLKSTKTTQPKAFTLIDLLLVVIIVFILAAMILPALSRPRYNSQSIRCVSQLKQINYAFRIFSYDNQNRFPMSIPEAEGGTLEYKDNPMATYRHFQVMSNELSVPKVLICPSDNNRVEGLNFGEAFEPDSTRRPATGSGVGNSLISYAVGVNASEAFPKMMVAGDRNLMVDGKDLSKGKSTPITLTPELATTNKESRLQLQYSESIHNQRGNVALADGSVQQFTSAALRDHILRTDRTEDEPMDLLAIPGDQ